MRRPGVTRTWSRFRPDSVLLAPAAFVMHNPARMIAEPTDLHRPGRPKGARFLLLLLILLAFARLTWRLEAKNLWLDEALSLQRAESSWPALLTGYLPLTDGVRVVDTTDQHPFAYFVFLGLMLRAAGESEFALRFPAVIAATLLVPAAWALARRLHRSSALPASTPMWAAFLVAINPFCLWFGREARMYAQVALLAVLSTYLLLHWADCRTRARRRLYLAGYGLATLLLLASHYFALLIAPLHAVLAFQALVRRDRRRALAAAAMLTILAAIPGGIAVWLLARDPGAGTNWSRISLRVLAPDLLNAFSLGMSVDIAQVWPVDLLYGAVALLGAACGLWRTRRTTRPLGWLLPALVIVPPAELLAINMIRPAYMTARHMSVISALFVVLVGGGVAWLWQTRRWLGGAVALIFVAGAAYSTINSFTLPQYDNGDVAGMGEYLRERVQPGDLLLLQPMSWGRLYRYYLPLDAIEQGERAGLGTGWRALPLLGLTDEEAIRELEALSQRYRRIWLAQSEGAGPVNDWLFAHTFRADDRAFESAYSGLKIALLLPQPPVRPSGSVKAQHSTDIVFGNQVKLMGYDVGQALMAGGALPVTLYWQPVSPISRRYKYILRLVSDGNGDERQVLGTTETEPYNGFLPTTAWPAKSMIIEYSGVPSLRDAKPRPTRLVLQVYDAETLEKLPVTQASGAEPVEDTNTILLTTQP